MNFAEVADRAITLIEQAQQYNRELIAEIEYLCKQNAEMREMLKEIVETDDTATEADITDTEAYELLDNVFYKIRAYLSANPKPDTKFILTLNTNTHEND